MNSTLGSVVPLAMFHLRGGKIKENWAYLLCIVLSQRSLGSILLPPPSVRYTRMRKEQEATFAKRESDQIAVGWVIT